MALLLIVHVLYFLLALHFRRIYNGDSYEYIYMALNLKERFWFYCGSPAMPVLPEYMTLRQPGYPIFMLLVYLFSVNNWAVLVIQNLLSVYSIYYLRNTIRRIGYTRSYDWLFIALLVIFPSQFINANMIAPDILLQFFVIVYFRHFVLMIRYREWRHAWIMSAGLIAGLLVKPVLYPFVYIHLIIMLSCILYISGRRYIPIITAIMPLMVVWLYMFWNYERTGKLHYSSNQAFNAIYYYYSYYEQEAGRSAADKFLEAERSKINAMPLFKDRYDYANSRGIGLLKDNFVPYSVFHLKRSARLLVDPGKGELDMFTGALTVGQLYSGKTEGLWQHYKKYGWEGVSEYADKNPSFPLAIVILIFNCIKLLGLLLFLLASKINIRIRLFAVLLILYFVVTAGAIAHVRYFIPVSLIAIGCSVMGYQLKLQQLKNRAIIERYTKKLRRQG